VSNDDVSIIAAFVFVVGGDVVDILIGGDEESCSLFS